MSDIDHDTINHRQDGLGLSDPRSVAADRNFLLHVLAHHTIVRSAADDADLFVELTNSAGAKSLYPIASTRHHEALNVLADTYSRGDPEAFVNKAQFQDIQDFLRGKAHRVAATRPVFKRTAYLPDENVIWIDLARDDGLCVLVAAAGWTLEEPLHSLFVRYPTQRPLPCPEVCDDSEAAFRRILPPGISAEAAKLLLGAVLGCFIPRNFAASFSYPVILLTGEAGSGKSTLAKLIKTLIDNEVTTAAAKPRSVDDLFVDAQAAHLVSYDNMDFVRGNLSDAICQLTTGSAISKRKLYTNADRAILRAHGPVMLNGINPDIPKSDLIDRSINIHLARITDYNPDAANRTDANLPLVMGHICDLLARALRNYAATEVSDAPRLALVAKVAAAAEPFGCSTPFVDLLRSNQQEALVSSQDNDLVTAALFALLTRNTTWTGTYKHLLETLTASADDATCRSPEWPASPRKLAHHMREHAQLLRAQGIDFANGPKKEAGRIVTVRRLPDASADNLDIPF